mmetsp:Transcript_65465/g.188638  ORF Transcript_65465/g.188638 Transcript_65465/m.188638 type:complete len:210 (+) Transcript_65465:1606-2235(+)
MVRSRASCRTGDGEGGDTTCGEIGVVERSGAAEATASGVPTRGGVAADSSCLGATATNAGPASAPSATIAVRAAETGAGAAMLAANNGGGIAGEAEGFVCGVCGGVAGSKSNARVGGGEDGGLPQRWPRPTGGAPRSTPAETFLNAAMSFSSCSAPRTQCKLRSSSYGSSMCNRATDRWDNLLKRSSVLEERLPRRMDTTSRPQAKRDA